MLLLFPNISFENPVFLVVEEARAAVAGLLIFGIALEEPAVFLLKTLFIYLSTKSKQHPVLNDVLDKSNELCLHVPVDFITDWLMISIKSSDRLFSFSPLNSNRVIESVHRKRPIGNSGFS